MTIKRRTVVQGAAWGAPAVVLASAVPAFAASPVTEFFVHGAVSRRSDNLVPSNLETLQLDMSKYAQDASAGVTDPNLDGFALTNTAAGQTVSSIRITLYFAYSGLTFTLAASSVSGGWTVGGAAVPNPNVPTGYYAYTFTLSDRTSTSPTTNFGATVGADNLIATATPTAAPGTYPYTIGGADSKFYAAATATLGGATYNYTTTVRNIAPLPPA